MNSRLRRLAANCVRGWTWLYTWRMPPAFRETRRAEIESDLWEFQCDAAGDPRLDSPLHILLRFLIGIPDDIGWRVEQTPIAETLTQGSMALSARVAGAALFICAFWVIDADASRKCPAIAVTGPAVVFDTQIEGIMRTRAGYVSHSAASSLSLLTAGIVATAGLSMSPPLAAQSPPIAASGPVFEAASVKPNTSGDARVILVPQPGGRLTGTNVTAAMLIRFAYDLPDFQVLGGPTWLNSDRFDVLAKAEGDPSVDQKRWMVRRLLAERFRLTAHTETRALPIYALVMARRDGRMGPQLRPTEADCAR